MTSTYNLPDGCDTRDYEGERAICDCGKECQEGETECPRCQNCDDLED
jgi:hypothetical protein